MVAYPTSEDVVIEALEVYREDALERGAEAARNLANEKRGAFGSSVGADQATWLPNAEVDGAIFILALCVRKGQCECGASMRMDQATWLLNAEVEKNYS